MDLIYYLYVFIHTDMSVSYSIEVTCLDPADLLALLHLMFSCVFVTFS